MKYDNPTPKTRMELESNLNSDNIELIAESLVSLSLYEKDWRWAQNICISFLNSESSSISGLAATCLGHIARIHNKLDKEKVTSILKSKINDPFIGGCVQNALDDIEIYLS